MAQNDHLSPGVLRFIYDASADSGAGDIVSGSGEVMAPNAGLDGDKANGLALGPCKPGAPASCTHALYMGGLLDGFIRRINNPEEPLTRNMTVDVVAMTTEQRVGTAGKGINGSMGMLGDDLYLPENQGFTVVKNISKCPAAGQVCGTVPLNIAQFGFIFGSAIGVDPDPQHLRSQAGLVYAAVSPGASHATVYQYDVATNTVARLRDPRPDAGGGLRRGDRVLHDDVHAAGRPGQPAGRPRRTSSSPRASWPTPRRLGLHDRGRLRRRPRRPRPRLGRQRPAVPGGVTPVPLPIPAPPPATDQTCNVTRERPGAGQRPDVLGAVHRARYGSDQLDLEDPGRAVGSAAAVPRQPVQRARRPGRRPVRRAVRSPSR